jgi:hypothetical protein
METPVTLGPVLDVASAIIFFFALMALIASSIQEIIAAVLSSRGKVLQQMLTQLLSHQPEVAGATDLLDKVLDHPLIANLGTYNFPAWIGRFLNTTKLPSYVPSANFATALIETLRQGHDDTIAVTSQISRGIAALPDNSPVKQTLQGFIVETRGEIDAFRTRVQTWYDDAMDRAAGVYKRFVQYTLLIIGLLMAIALNADVISIADTLWYDKNMRDVVSAAATEYMKANPQPQTALTSDAAEQQVKQAGTLVGKLPLPVGWDTTSSDTSTSTGLLVARKILGFLLTAFAISLGAPFWFDLLQTVANLRGAGPKPARADAT